MAAISVPELESLCREVFEAHDFDSEAADACIAEIVDAECRGRRSHGIAMVPRLLKAGKSGAAPAVALDAPGFARIDGNGAAGPLVSKLAMDAAIEKAREWAFGAVGTNNDSSFLTAGYQPRRAAERGLIGVAFSVAAPKLAPWGSAEALLGTNPIGIALPADPAPVVLDMSIGELTVADARRLARAGERLPGAGGVSASGTPTDDPAEALEGALLPFGGHRGSGLGVMIELLAGPLVGAHAGPLPGAARGTVFIAVDPDCFGYGAEFAGAVTAFLDHLRSSPAREGFSEALAPGDRALAQSSRSHESGLTLDDGAYEKLLAAKAAA
ncbi:MAG TPA: Ldh family oxidoreductase [Solirubrobacterales bacterium]|nr:Ldh family oxidoreductase [Solirubrobacterales bacterium]